MRAVSKKKAQENRAKGPIREAVFERDHHRCRLLGVEGAGRCFGGLTAHHIVKASRGGPYAVENLATLCAFHNDHIEADADLATLAESLGLVRRRGAA